MIFKYLLSAIIIFTACLSQISAQVFAEKDGIVKIEMETIPLLQNWQLLNDGLGYSGDGYIAWIGPEYFNNTSNGKLDYKIKITNPGTYAFKWYSRVGKGTNTTDHNDTWLKISGATDFYGKKSSGDIVRPHGVCTNDCPNGSGEKGYFKIYANHLSWAWHTSTSDHDPHEIYADFDVPGIYTINIAARSSWHYIDKMVLYNVGMTNQNTATSNTTPFSDIIPFRNFNDTIVFESKTLQYEIRNISETVSDIQAYALNAEITESVSVSEITDKTATLTLNIHENISGSSDIKLVSTYNTDQTIEMQFNVTVVGEVNLPPTIDQVPDLSVNLSDEIQTREFTGITDGNNGTQAVYISLSRTPSSRLIINGLEHDGGETATLYYTTRQEGEVSFRVVLKDDGGTDFGGVDMAEMTFTMNIVNPTSTDDSFQNKVLLFPNPSRDILNINLAKAPFPVSNIELINMVGQVAYSRKVNEQKNSLLFQVGHLPKGEYFVRLSSEHHHLTERIVLF